MKTIFKGKIVGIRPFREDDVVPFYEAAISSPHVYEFLPWCHPKYTLEESRAWVNSRANAWDTADEYSFIIYSLDSEELWGSVSINQINQQHRFGNIGYWVRKKALNRGVASEAVALIKEFGFAQLGLNRLEILAEVHNQASRRVAEKAGARFEGVLQKRLLNKGVAVDAAMYALVKNA